MMTYLFQGWNCRGPQKYRDMLLDIGTEEIAHVEMLATMIARLLEAVAGRAAGGGAKNSLIGAAMGGSNLQDVIAGGMNPQHAIVSGSGATPNDSVGYPWNSRYYHRQRQPAGRLPVQRHRRVPGASTGGRLYDMTEDQGVRDMLPFMIARDTMHQNQWVAAIAELEADGLEATPCPSSFPLDQEMREVAYEFWNCSEGLESRDGRWAAGTAPDGRGQFEYLERPSPLAEAPVLGTTDPRLHGTPKAPVRATT